MKFSFTYVPEEEKITMYSGSGSEINGWRKAG